MIAVEEVGRAGSWEEEGGREGVGTRAILRVVESTELIVGGICHANIPWVPGRDSVELVCR